VRARRASRVGVVGLVGLGLGLAYVATIGITLGLHPGRLRPLYEGFTPPSTYHWVNPPRIFAAGNQKPGVTRATVKLGPQGSLATGISTDDAQLVLGLAAGAVAPHGSDTSVAVTITPVDPGELAPLKAPYRANGNAYLIAMAYQPSRAPVPALADPGASMVLVTPEVGPNLFTTTSARGPWTAVASHAVPPTDLTLGASVKVPGYYLAGTTLPPPVFHHGSSVHTVEVSVAVGVLAVLVIGAGVVFSRRRRRRPS
jgi:hypothetical protein